MPGSQGSSFIPKQPARGVVQKRTVRKIYVLAYISFVLFFGTLIAAGGTFFYKVTVDAQLQSERSKLVAQRDSFSEADIESVKALHAQIEAAEQLLDEHISVLPIFAALEASTLETVQFDSMSIERSPTNILVALEAETENFNSLLFQRSIAEDNLILGNATFGDVKATKAALTEFSPALGANLFNEDALLVSFSLERSLQPSDVGYQPGAFTQPAAFTDEFDSFDTEPVLDDFSEGGDDTGFDDAEVVADTFEDVDSGVSDQSDFGIEQ